MKLSKKDSRLNSSSIFQDPLKRIKLSKKSRTNLILQTIIVTLCCFFFSFEAIIYKKLESIELKLFRQNEYFFFLPIVSRKLTSRKNQIIINRIMEIIGGTNSLIIYISTIYLFFHPFIGVKLVFVMNSSHYFLEILKIIFQGQRPLWEIYNSEIYEQKFGICENLYAIPSIDLFFCSFFFIYTIISLKLVQKTHRLNNIQRFFIFFPFIFITLSLTIILGETLVNYFHQLVYTLIICLVFLCLLIEYDTSLHNFIFKSLKNMYNTRIYKIKILFYIIGCLCCTIVVICFIEDKEENKIKEILSQNKNCKDEDIELFGIKGSSKELCYLFGIVGAFWGVSFTVEKNIGKWWGKKSPKIIFMKILSIIIVNSFFISTKMYISNLKGIYELAFILGLILNFLQYYTLFGLIPFFLELIKLNEKKRKNTSFSSKRDGLSEKDEKVLFKSSIFIERKKSEEIEGFLVFDKINQKEEHNIDIDNNNKINININDIGHNITIEENKDINKSKENEELLLDKNENEEEIYNPTSLIENLGNHIENKNIEFILEETEEINKEKEKETD